MDIVLKHFYWYGYAVSLFIGAENTGLDSAGDLIACALVALSSWGGVIYTLLF